MILTTTPSVEGQQIIDYVGIVSGEAIMGANNSNRKEALKHQGRDRSFQNAPSRCEGARFQPGGPRRQPGQSEGFSGRQVGGP